MTDDTTEDTDEDSVKHRLSTRANVAYWVVGFVVFVSHISSSAISVIGTPYRFVGALIGFLIVFGLLLKIPIEKLFGHRVEAAE